MRYIDVEAGITTKIVKVFNVSRMTVWKALNNHSDTDIAKRIRKMAIENGGVEKMALPIWETFHDADGFMRQYYPNGARIEIDKSTGNATAYYKDAIIARIEDISFPALERLQNKMKNYKN